ncbi:MAG: tetratricopeptide repeat protein [Pseudomonadota bacterium]
MPTMTDSYGGMHSSDNTAAIAAFEAAVFAVLAHRPAADALKQAHAHDPGLIAGHVLKGLGSVLLGKAENFVSGRKLAAKARAALQQSSTPTPSENALVDALDVASRGELSQAAARLESHVAANPTDILALKLSNALRFMCGDRDIMVATTGAALRSHDAAMPGYGFVLGLHAFGLEECGHYTEAERFGRMSVTHEPADSWGVHAVGHVLEMEGRTHEGIAWLDASRGLWPRCNNFGYHLAWHLALFHLELADYDQVLQLYDDEIRPEPTDDFRDVSNAVALLWRLEQHGIWVGPRWHALHELALKRRTDTSYVFASLHYLLVLLAVGDEPAAHDLVQAMQTAHDRQDEQGLLASQLGVDLAKAMLRLAFAKRKPGANRPELFAQRRSDFARLAQKLPSIGGSHAQRDVFVRTLQELAAHDGDGIAVDLVMRARHRFRKQDRYDALVRDRLRYRSLEPRFELVPQHGVH